MISPISQQDDYNQSKPEEIKEGRAMQLLFVDDEEDDLLLFQIGLEALNLKHTVQHARSGNEMFEMLEATNPDFIFLDILMPGKSGIACLKLIRNKKKYEQVPIIIYSKYSQPSFIEDCYLAKANYYVLKSGDIGSISAAFAKIFSTDWETNLFPQRDRFLIYPEH